MSNIARGLVAVLALSGALGFAGAALAQDGAKRSITHVSGGLYRFQNNFHVSVFLVTGEGIIVTDPINAAAATWLLAELRKRFDQPVKYLVYSHDHSDHSAGGEVFAQAGALVVAHANAKATIIGEKRPTAVPDITFTERLTLELGGKTMELIYPGRSHSDNLIVMRFPEERAVFTVDFISVNRVAYQTLSDAWFPDWIEAIEVVEGLDFDVLIPGHGPIGTKADASAHREYLQALYDAVLAGARAGSSLEELRESIRLPRFSHFGQYEAWLALNVEGMYRQIALHRRGN